MNETLYSASWNVTQLTNVSWPEGRCKWTSQNTALSGVLAVTFILNVLASIVLFRVPLVTIRGRSNPVYLCIRLLNVADAVQAGLLLAMPALADRDCSWLGGDICCQVMGFLALSLLLVSPVITILMAFDRMIALYQPFKYRSHLGLKMLKILLPVACSFVFASTALPLGGVGEYHVVRGRRLCLLDTITDDPVDRVYVLAVHSLILIALAFMAACTVAFQVKMTTMTFAKKHKPLSRAKRREKNRTRSATTTTMAVCCIFIVCYLPYVSRVLSEASSGVKSPSIVTWLTFGLAFLQPMLNPVVYLATNVRYRQEVQLLLRRIKPSDIEASTGSLTGTSRGGLSEFRRRFSSSAHRKDNKQATLKDKELQESTTSPGTSGKIVPESGFSPFWKTQQRSGEISDVFVEGNSCHVQACSSLERHYADKLFYRHQSASSGVKSMDSREHAVPPHLHEAPLHCTFSKLYSPSGKQRERSHTICGRSSLSIEAASKAHAPQCSCSVPSLTNIAVRTKSERVHFDEQPLLGDKENIAASESRLTPTSRTPASLVHRTSENITLKLRHSGMLEISNKSLCRNGDVTDECAKKREVSSTKKPAHRDSGMVDTSDPST